MRHTLPIAPQFYVTAPQPCPYLEQRMERKLFTSLHGAQARELNDTLSKQGFRRSQNVLYRPTCTDCAACLSARIRVSDFVPNKRHLRNLKRNRNLIRDLRTPWATEAQFELFKKYLMARHKNGGMADMDMFEFAAMIEETPVETHVVEYHDTEAEALLAVCLTDVLDDGVSLVYSFFDPDQSRRSLGIYMILDHIALARELGLPFVYLGYWVPQSTKMDYKSQFSGLEIHFASVWQKVGNPDDYNNALHPLSNDPIAEQVANIVLP